MPGRFLARRLGGGRGGKAVCVFAGMAVAQI